MTRPLPALVLPLAVGLALLVGLLSGLRLPGLWPATSFLFDYHFGFSKRALVGQLSTLLGHRLTYAQVAILSFTVLAAWLLLLFRAARDAGPPAGWVLAAFFLSHGFLYAIHTVGYADHWGLLIALGCLLLPITAAGLLARLALSLVMVLVHEGLFLYLFPVILFDAVLRGLLAPRRALPLSAAAVTALLVAVTTWVLGHLTLPRDLFDQAVAYLSSRAADFPVRDDTIAVLFRDGPKNAALMAEVWSRPETPDRVRTAIELDLPFVLVMTGLSAWLAHGLPLSRPWRAAVVAGATLCALSPFAVTLFAWDFERFAAQAQTASVLAWLALARTAPPQRLPAVALALLAAASVYNLARAPTLFDDYAVRRPPFTDAAATLADHLRNGTLLAPPDF